ncbi:uncharacterized protein LOC113360207 [Papaver somniferum]|uniref:uncharacterized protein LOC113360207 n=1 Tax=Papaver somniferum TaxID=3469 RepID=UPI000E705D4A|nr:uncharacterized protein LOC113360207 [Papaver somniferum]
MSKLFDLDFMALDITGKNYLSWILDAEAHLSAKTLGNTIVLNNKESPEDHSKALIFLCHHLDEALKSRYLTVKDPYTLWIELKDRFDHQKTVILPRARYEWMHMRLQNFKSIKKYSELISCLLVAEQNNELLLKNHQSHPAGSIVAPEMNAMKLPEGFRMPEADKSKGRSVYSIKLQRALYGLKQSGRMWYNRLSY